MDAAHKTMGGGKKKSLAGTSAKGRQKPAAQPEEVDLILRAQSGEMFAFEELYLHYRGRLQSFILGKYLRNRSDARDTAKDIVSETFAKASQSIGSYDPAKAAFSTWLFNIAKNVCIDSMRRSEHEVNVRYENRSDWDGESSDPITARADYLAAAWDGYGLHGGVDHDVADEPLEDAEASKDEEEKPPPKKPPSKEKPTPKVKPGAWRRRGKGAEDDEWGDIFDWQHFFKPDQIIEALEDIKSGIYERVCRDGEDYFEADRIVYPTELHDKLCDLSRFQREILFKYFTADLSKEERTIHQKLAGPLIEGPIRESLLRQLKASRAGRKIEEEKGSISPLIDSRPIRRAAIVGDPHAKDILEKCGPDTRTGNEWYEPLQSRTDRIGKIAKEMKMKKEAVRKQISLIKKKF